MSTKKIRISQKHVIKRIEPMKQDPHSVFVRAAQNDACKAAQNEQVQGVDCGGCPMPKSGEMINEVNMMPNTSNEPSKGQKYPLDTNRQLSSIPVSQQSNLPAHQEENSKNWIYPSEQMFYNAMKRKGYDATEQDMTQVVMLHNVVNERCWQEVMQWEALHCDKCPQPTLKNFQGRPKDYSLRARWFQLWGYKLPFDRHDWVVDRCGEEVRYIIDFYSGLPDGRSPVSMFLDTRPALDSVGAVTDRLFMAWKKLWEEEGELKEGVQKVTKVQNYNIVQNQQSS